MKAMKQNQPLQSLLKHRDIWQASAVAQHSNSLPTGHSLLDDTLHLGGWPVNTLVELLCSQAGMGEMLLLNPLLASLSTQNRWLFFINPPFIPCATALHQQGIQLQQVVIIQTQNQADQLWAMEQVLRSDTCGACLTWLYAKNIPQQHLRKLQLAAQSGSSQAFLFRPPKAAKQASPAKLRLVLQAQNKHCLIHILKQPGGWSGQHLQLKRPDFLTHTYIPAHALPVHIPAKSIKHPAKAGMHLAEPCHSVQHAPLQ